MSSESTSTQAIAVYCGSSFGAQSAYQKAADAPSPNRRLVYGGGEKGIMGVIAGAVLDRGGKVTGVIPRAMLKAGGEKSRVEGSAKSGEAEKALEGRQSDRIETVTVDSMHERKLEMCNRVAGFVVLPGGYGTYDELMEVTTWNQLGIQHKPTVVLNVSNYFTPLRQLIRIGVQEGFIQPQNEDLIYFVDGPENLSEHETFDWGKAALEAVEKWASARPDERGRGLYDWGSKPMEVV